MAIPTENEITPHCIPDSKLSSRFTLSEQATSLAASPNGCYVVAGFTSGTIRLYNTMSSNDKEGAIIGHFTAKGLHTSLLLQVIISEDCRFCFAGVLRGSAMMHAIDMSFLPTWSNYDRKAKLDVDSILRVHSHSDAKLKGFGGATRILPPTMTSTSTLSGNNDLSALVAPDEKLNNQSVLFKADGGEWAEYLLICGRGIKNIHIWSFKIALKPNGEHNLAIEPSWDLIHDIGTNGMTIELIGFCFGGKTAYSRSKNYGLRLWDLSTKATKDTEISPTTTAATTNNVKEKKLVPQDIAHSIDMQSVAGGLKNGFAFGGEYALAVIKLGSECHQDVPQSFKGLRTEVELPDILDEEDTSASSSSSGGGGGRKRRVVRALARVLPTEDANEALLICTDGTSFHYANSGDAAGTAGLISRYPKWQSSDDHSAVFKLCALPGNVALISADWLDKDREGTLLIRPLLKVAERTKPTDVATFWGNSFLKYWPLGERNISPPVLPVATMVRNVRKPVSECHSESISPRSSTPRTEASNDAPSSRGSSTRSKNSATVKPTDPEVGSRRNNSSFKMKPTPGAMKRSSSASSQQGNKSSKTNATVNATPINLSSTIAPLIRSTSSSSTTSSHKKGGRGGRSGRLSINGQEVLGTLLDAEVASQNTSDDAIITSEDDEDFEGFEELETKTESVKVLANNFTAVMVKKRSHQEDQGLKETTSSASSFSSSSAPLTAVTTTLPLQAVVKEPIQKKVRAPFVPAPPPIESNMVHEMDPLPPAYTTVIQQHQKAVNELHQFTELSSEEGTLSSSSTPLVAALSDYVPQPITGLHNNGFIPKNQELETKLSLYSAMKNSIQNLEYKFQLDFDRLKINMTEALARLAIGHSSWLIEENIGSKSQTAVEYSSSSFSSSSSSSSASSSLPLALRRKSIKRGQDMETKQPGQLSMNINDGFEWGEEVLAFVKHYEDASKELQHRHQLEADSFKSTQQLQLLLMKMKSPDSLEKELVSFSKHCQDEEDHLVVSVPQVKLCGGFNVAQLVFEQISISR